MTRSAREALGRVATGLPPTGLMEVVAMADLQTRMDRKYLVPSEVFEQFVASMSGRLAALDIDGRRLFRYESVYFDTTWLTAYRQHAHGRRRRFKVRTRSYLDSAECVFEVKTEGGRGETVKDRLPYSLVDRYRLTDQARAFALPRVGDPALVSELVDVLTTAYVRATLVDPECGSRITCDVDLSFDNGGQRRHGPPTLVLVESKTAGAAAVADSVLWRLGQRPVSVSKYCVGLAMLRPELPANRWNRELRAHFGWTPRREVYPPGR